MIKDTDFKQICENWQIMAEFMPKAHPEVLENILWIRKFVHKYLKALEVYYYSPNNPSNLEAVETKRIELEDELKHYDSFSVRYLPIFSHEILVKRPKAHWLRLYYGNTDITPILCIF